MLTTFACIGIFASLCFFILLAAFSWEWYKSKRYDLMRYSFGSLVTVNQGFYRFQRGKVIGKTRFKLWVELESGPQVYLSPDIVSLFIVE